MGVGVGFETLKGFSSSAGLYPALNNGPVAGGTELPSLQLSGFLGANSVSEIRAVMAAEKLEKLPADLFAGGGVEVLVVEVRDDLGQAVAGFGRDGGLALFGGVAGGLGFAGEYVP